MATISAVPARRAAHGWNFRTSRPAIVLKHLWFALTSVSSSCSAAAGRNFGDGSQDAYVISLVEWNIWEKECLRLPLCA